MLGFGFQPPPLTVVPFLRRPRSYTLSIECDGAAQLQSFQVLPIVYRVEHMLHRLKQFGARFRVFFLSLFDSWGWTG